MRQHTFLHHAASLTTCIDLFGYLNSPEMKHQKADFIEITKKVHTAECADSFVVANQDQHEKLHQIQLPKV
jgi:hypothetical protein